MLLQQNADKGCKCCATFARLRVVAAIILKFYRKFYRTFYCSCDQSLTYCTYQLILVCGDGGESGFGEDERLNVVR